MTNTYFKNVNTLEELRRQYKELLKKFHPDNPDGSTEATQEINSEYERLFKLLKDKHEEHTTDNKENSSYDNMKYNFEEDELLREMLNKVVHFSDITIEIIGNWIWLSGNTYQYRKEFKELGFKWGNTKKAWYWHSEAFRKKSHKTLSMNDIRNYYGSTEVETNAQKKIATA